jgi:hypothetical protein
MEDPAIVTAIKLAEANLVMSSGTRSSNIGGRSLLNVARDVSDSPTSQSYRGAIVLAM